MPGCGLSTSSMVLSKGRERTGCLSCLLRFITEARTPRTAESDGWRRMSNQGSVLRRRLSACMLMLALASSWRINAAVLVYA